MSIYVIGDVHGCYNELRSLFTRIKFNPDKDTAVFVGDLIGRGPQSKDVLDFVMNLGQSAICLLGNHEIKLLGLLYGLIESRSSDNLLQILGSLDRKKYLDWLSKAILIYSLPGPHPIIVHAGIPPIWTLEMAQKYADLVENYKAEFGLEKLIKLYLEKPCYSWQDEMCKEDIISYTIFGFTKMKLCNQYGGFNVTHQGAPCDQTSDLMPWYTLRQQWQNDMKRIIFGHWAALGLYQNDIYVCCDSGCVWGGQLSAFRLGGNELELFQVQSKFNAHQRQMSSLNEMSENHGISSDFSK